jgi:hypothetical protein
LAGIEPTPPAPKGAGYVCLDHSATVGIFRSFELRYRRFLQYRDITNLNDIEGLNLDIDVSSMMQGNAREATQFVDRRTGPSQSPMVVQVSPQNQVFRQIDFRLMPSEQGMLSIGTQGGNAMQSSDRYSGTESTTAHTSPQQQSHAMCAMWLTQVVLIHIKQ